MRNKAVNLVCELTALFFIYRYTAVINYVANIREDTLSNYISTIIRTARVVRDH